MNRCSYLIVLASLTLMGSGCVTTSDHEALPTSPEEAARYNTQLGVGYLRQGRLKLAKEKLEKALEQDPTQAEVHTAVAFLYEQLGETRKADSHYRTAVRLDPDNPTALNNYGVFLCRHGQPGKAERYFLEALGNALYPTPEAAYTNAGVCARRTEHIDKAEFYFRRALNQNPRFADALWQMADLSFDTENYMAARAFLQRYMSSAPMTAEVLWLGARIERALGDEPAAAEYEERLKREYPDSVQARDLLQARAD